MQLSPLDAESLEAPLIPGGGLRVGEEIGRGGMGCVLRASDTSLGRIVAMKVLREDLADKRPDRRRVLRFLREARLTGQLQHPGIVPVLELGLADGNRIYYSMPLVRGSSLEEIFSLSHDHGHGLGQGEDGAWPLGRVVAILARVCETVAYAHDQGVIHRDLKPANIMVGEFNEAYVLDWGLARRMQVEDGDREGRGAGPAGEEGETDELVTLEGAFLGTPEFMAPEQLGRLSAKIGPPADIHALGAILYTLLAGTWPYHSGGRLQDRQAVIAGAQSGPPAPIRQVAPDQPPELLAICEKAMLEEPQDRYGDGRAMARDLRAFTEHRVVQAYKTGAVAELAKWCSRNRTVASGLLGILLVILASLIFGARASRAASEEAAAKRDVAVRASERILHLADDRRLELLGSEVDAAWPATSANLDALHNLGRRAEALLQRRDMHTAALSTLRQRALPQRPEEAAAQARKVQARLAELRQELAGNDRLRSQIEEVLAQATGDEMARARLLLARFERKRGELLQAVEAQQARLGKRQHWSFQDPADAWQEKVLVGLLTGMDQLPEAITSLEQREAAAAAIERLSLTGPNARRRWALALADIGGLSVYAGLHLPPQEGLLPLKRDERSGLWEFLHLQSGQGPEGQGGVILVLLPPGGFQMGSYGVSSDHPSGSPLADPECQSFLESPAMQVRLDAFFIGKYELTQAQWERSGLENPSTDMYVGDVLQFPVHDMTWHDAAEYCRRMRFSLPTEAQWEYACRAGTTTVYWCGDDKSGLRECDNVASQDLGESFTADKLEAWKDGGKGPVVGGHYRGNAFGLFDLHGNVREWCRNRLFDYAKGVLRQDDGVPVPLHRDRHRERVARGGSWRLLASEARSAYRSVALGSYRGDDLGLRVVWEISR